MNNNDDSIDKLIKRLPIELQQYIQIIIFKTFLSEKEYRYQNSHFTTATSLMKWKGKHPVWNYDDSIVIIDSQNEEYIRLIKASELHCLLQQFSFEHEYKFNMTYLRALTCHSLLKYTSDIDINSPLFIDDKRKQVLYLRKFAKIENPNDIFCITSLKKTSIGLQIDVSRKTYRTTDIFSQIIKRRSTDFSFFDDEPHFHLPNIMKTFKGAISFRQVFSLCNELEKQLKLGKSMISISICYIQFLTILHYLHENSTMTSFWNLVASLVSAPFMKFSNDKT